MYHKSIKIPFWITSSSTGIINYQDTETFEFTIDTQGLTNGSYNATVIVEDPYQYIADTLDVNLSISGVVGVVESPIPYDFALYQNYPNPFNPSTDIRFSLPKLEKVNLIVYDLLGNTVKEIVNKVNSYFGYELINEVKLQAFNLDRKKLKQKNSLNKFSKDFNKKIKEIKNEKLKNSLLQLTEVIKND